MKTLFRLIVMGLLLLSGDHFFHAVLAAENLLLDSTTFSKQYIVQLSGTVMNETFSGAQALLTVMPPSPASIHPYQIMIQGMPNSNSRNTFYWATDDTEMTVAGNDVTSIITRSFVKSVPIHFFFLSPALLNQMIFLTQHDDERKRLAESTALPTRIAAQAGQLKLRIYSNSVSGTISIKGYDPIEKAYIQYSAKLYGKPVYNIQPRLKKTK
jgi:hypothetical protein